MNCDIYCLFGLLMIGAGGALVMATPSPANCVCLIKPFENSSVVARENVPMALPLKVICTCPTLPGAIFSLGLKFGVVQPQPGRAFTKVMVFLLILVNSMV